MAHPIRFGLILYPGYEVLDVFGPIEALNVLSRPELGPSMRPVSLCMIAATLDPVPSMATTSLIQQTVLPTHTFATAPEIDVLLVPGGMTSGNEDVGMQELVKFIAARFHSLKNLITVCTGADLAARAGVLDGRRATTNKVAWAAITSKPTSSHTYWVAHARWVIDGKVWTTSGVSAGTDGMLEWITKTYSNDVANDVAVWMEYKRDDHQNDDPFAKIHHCKDVPPKVK